MLPRHRATLRHHLSIWRFITAALLLVIASPVLGNAAPSVTSLSPTSGAVGAQVTISGAGFGSTQGNSTVKFGNTAATTIATWSATQIVVTVPSVSTGSQSVVVRVSNANSNATTFTVVAAPSIASLSPTGAASGATVTIAGSNFGSTQGASTVSFNGTAASPTSWSATSISVPVPATATTGVVVVRAGGVNSNGVAFTVAPSISGLSTTSGAAGTTVTLSGANFGATQGTSTIKFNGTTAQASSWSTSSVTAAVPAIAATGPVVIRVGSYDSNGIVFNVVPGPMVSAVTPTSAAVGASVVLAGSNFGNTQSTGWVTLGGVTASVTAWSATSVTATVPLGAVTGNAVIHASGTASNEVSFTVVPPPMISDVSPSGGAVGAPVVLTGTGFRAQQGSGVVRFNGVTASVASWTDTRISVAVPQGAASGSVFVDQSGVTSNGKSFAIGQAPQITSVTPGASTIGGAVTLTGTNFGATQGSSSIRFGDRSATALAWSNTAITTVVPAGGAGDVTVRVGGVMSNRLAFTPLTTIKSLTKAVVAARNGYTGHATVTFERPRRSAAAPRGLEVQFTWTHEDGEVFAIDRFLLSDLGALTTASIHSSVSGTAVPPWRVAVRAREVLADVPPGTALDSCNNELPYPGQQACGEARSAPPIGAVLAETTSEATVTGP